MTRPLETLVGTSEGTRIALEITDFSDGRPLRAELIGTCVAVAFYNLTEGRVFGSLTHPIRGTNPDSFFEVAKSQIRPHGTKAALVGSNNSHAFTGYFLKRLASLLEGAGYDLCLRGFDEPALRDATLYPDGVLRVYRHDTKGEEIVHLG